MIRAGPAWARHCINPAGKKAVASDEWLVARNSYEDSRVPTRTLKPRATRIRASGRALHNGRSVLVLRRRRLNGRTVNLWSSFGAPGPCFVVAADLELGQKGG